MPKIIKDVKEIIKQCAMDLFIDYGYEQVDMKMISKESGVSVGTIYNYYKNKKFLYTNILEESWQNTFIKLNAINTLSIPSKEKFIKFITTLYEDIESRNGLGKVIVNTFTFELEHDESIINLKETLISIIKEMIDSIDKVDSLKRCPDVNIRLTESLLASMTTLIQFHSDKKEDNILFLVEFLNLSIK